MAGRPLPDTKRNEIIALHAQGLTRNEIARQAGVSSSTVSKVCSREGLTFDRTKTMVATAAKVADSKLRRAELAEALLDDAFKLREELFAPSKAFSFGGRDNTYNEVTLDQPVFADQLKIMQAVDVAARRHEALVNMDTAGAQTAAESVLDRLAASFEAFDKANPEAAQ